MWMLFLFAIFYTLKSRFKFQFCHCFWALLNQNCLMLGEISLWNFLVLGCGFGGKYDEYFLCLFWCIWRECTSQTFKEEELSIKILRSLSSPYGVVKNTMEDAELLITQFYHGLNWGLVVLCCCFCSWFFIFGFSYDASCVLLCTICMPIQKNCLNTEVLWQFKILSIMCMYIHCVY